MSANRYNVTPVNLQDHILSLELNRKKEIKLEFEFVSF